MSRVIKIKKGLDIKLKGSAEKIISNVKAAETYALKPTDFPNLTPKLAVKENDELKAGDTLFYDKYNPDLKFTSPVSGKVLAINRGERRRILEVVVKADNELLYKDFGSAAPAKLSRDEIIGKMMESGAWPYIRQRPFAIIANPKTIPSNIFVSAFDSAPLAPDYDFIVKGESEAFKTGVEALKKLTSGKVHLTHHAHFPLSEVFAAAKDSVEIHQISGKHPAGNVGVQIHHIAPINKGDVVWFVNPADIIVIGRLFNKGVYDATKVIALTGSEVKNPRYHKTIGGTSIQNMVADNVENSKKRFISGNALNGTSISQKGYLGFYDHHITVIPEGDHYEFLGWAMPGLNKFSVSRTFLSWLTPKRQYRLDTNYNGGERAFVMTGQYEKVVPMDILPVQLLKAILANDIDKMEQLGIYEVVEEDLALCEFVCTSKIEVQKILREGITTMIKEMS